MKKSFLLFVLLQSLLLSCGQSPAVHQLSPEEFYEAIDKDNVIIIDVRTDKEYNGGHIKNAGQINFYSSDFKQKALLLPKDKDIYLYCHSGSRSNQAANFLIKNGYTKIYNLQNGIMAWNLKKLPLVRESVVVEKPENGMEPEQYKKLISSGKLVFIDFYAPWCAPCKKMMPVIDKLKTEYKGKIGIIDKMVAVFHTIVSNRQNGCYLLVAFEVKP